MQGINATNVPSEPVLRRKFAITFTCKDCLHTDEIIASTVSIPANAPYHEKVSRLECFHPFSCFNCGFDEFAIGFFYELD